MSQLEVCFSPDLLHLYSLEGKNVVVVDILRATSCMVTALSFGVKAIHPFSDLDECMRMKSKGLLVAAERDGMKVDGFDFGNSPFSFMEEGVAGKEIAFTTTNGTVAINKSRNADLIIIGAFLNLSSVINFIKTEEKDIVIVCAGWKGKFNLEDTIYAGALVENLHDFHTSDDGALAAKHLYQSAKNDLYGFLRDSSHFNRLQRLNIKKDIEFCLTPDQYSVIPVVQDGIIVKG